MSSIYISNFKLVFIRPRWLVFLKKTMKLLVFPFCCLFIIIACSKEANYTSLSTYETGEELSAGRLTTSLLGANAFDQAVPGLPTNTDLLFFVGNSLFKQNWVSAPASTTARDGLGPTFSKGLQCLPQ